MIKPISEDVREAVALHPVVLPPCAWEGGWMGKKQRVCGQPAKYEICEDDPPVPVCSFHQSRAASLGWRTRRRNAELRHSADSAASQPKETTDEK